MKQKTLLIIGLCVICIFSGSRAFANNFSVKTDKKIIWQGPQSHMSFSAQQEDDNVVIIVVKLNNKKITTRINFQTKAAHLVGENIDNGIVEVLTRKDSKVLGQLLNKMLDSGLNSSALGNTVLRVLNLLDSWPAEMPLDIKHEGEQVSSMNEAAESTSIINICEKVNQLHDGEYPIWGSPTPFEDIKVGPYPWGLGACMGRCGRQCAGDGTPDNGIYVYGQDCFNHDKCVDDLGALDLDCMSIFELAFDDFLIGPSCQKDNIDILVNDQDGPVDIVNDEIDIKLSIKDTSTQVSGIYSLYAETSSGYYSFTKDGWQLGTNITPYGSSSLKNFGPSSVYTGPLPEGFPSGKNTFYFSFWPPPFPNVFLDAVEVNVTRPANTFGGTSFDRGIYVGTD